MSDIEREWLTPPMVAKLLGMNARKVIRFIELGELKASNVSEGQSRPRYLVHRAAVAEFMKLREVVPPPPPQQRRGHRRPPDADVHKYY